MTIEQEIHDILTREGKKKKSKSAYFLEKLQQKPELCLWGLGRHGHNWYSYLHSLGIKISAVYDRSEWAVAQWGGAEKKIFSFEELKEHLPKMTILVTIRNPESILAELSALRFTDAYAATVNLFSFDTERRYTGQPQKLQKMECSIYRILNLLEDETSRHIVHQTVAKWFDESHKEIDCIGQQYFVSGLVPLDEMEHFVDVGAYDGDTIDAFLKTIGNRYAHIYAFEMGKENLSKLYLRTENDPRWDKKRITVYPYGLSDKDETVHYEANGTSSAISKNGSETAELRRLDGVLQDVPVTFIKMDIEGAEPLALAGAANTIRRNRPKLAICTYHKAEHLWQIPEQILALCPDYRFYFRHHDPDEMETVCYAIPKNLKQ